MFKATFLKNLGRPVERPPGPALVDWLPQQASQRERCATVSPPAQQLLLREPQQRPTTSFYDFILQIEPRSSGLHWQE